MYVIVRKNGVGIYTETDLESERFYMTEQEAINALDRLQKQATVPLTIAGMD